MVGGLTTTTSFLQRQESASVAATTIFLACAIVCAPLTRTYPIILNVLTSAAVAAAVFVIGTSAKWLFSASVLGAIKAVEVWTGKGSAGGVGFEALLVLGDLLLFLLAARVMLIVYRPGRSIPTRLTAAVTGYLIGITIFAGFHGWVLVSDPGAIAAANLPIGATLENADLMYFSVVTQTTLGYGDMTPIAPASRVLCMAQSIFGVLYIAVTIAGLVGTRSDTQETIGMVER